MGERSHTAGARKWSWTAASLMLCAVGVGIVAAGPGDRKKPATGSQPNTAAAGKTQSAPDSQSATEAARTAASLTGSSEPIVAKVNNQVITYKQLAEECIARKGKEILDTMISKMLVMQAMREKGIKVSPAEIDEEVGRTAQRWRVTREQFLTAMKEERNIEPKQYYEDIVMPGLALKKLATPFVQVTEDDIQRGFEAQYGEKVKCRWLMAGDMRTATNVWNELRESSKDNSGKIKLEEFERCVTRHSLDMASRANGGQIQPIAHHTSPQFQKIEQAAFAMKEDGEISPVVQVNNSWVILYREARIAPQNVKIESVRPNIESDIYEAKLREQIASIFEDLRKNAAIENLLTGDVSPRENVTAGPDKPAKPKGEPAKVGSTKDASKKTPDTLKK